MYAISKLSPISQGFLNSLISSGRSRSKEVSLALARVLNSSVSVPGNVIEDPVGFYRTQHKVNVDAMIGRLNELIVIDIDAISDYCQKYFMYRYTTVNLDRNVLAFTKDTAVEDFFNISRYFDSSTMVVLRSDPLFIVSVMQGFENIIEDLNKS